MLGQGSDVAVLLASRVICAAVLRYKELCEGSYKGAMQLLPVP